MRGWGERRSWGCGEVIEKELGAVVGMERKGEGLPPRGKGRGLLPDGVREGAAACGGPKRRE